MSTFGARCFEEPTEGSKSLQGNTGKKIHIPVINIGFLHLIYFLAGESFQ